MGSEMCIRDRSAGGQSANEDTGIHDSLTQLVLMPYNPAERKAITVFTKDGCNGHSAVLWDDEEYNNTEEQLTIGANIRSIMVPSGDGWWIDAYSTENCQVSWYWHYWEMRDYHQDTIGRNHCINVSE